MNHESIVFESPVWRVMPDHGGPGLAVELRNKEEKTVQFIYVNLLTGKQVYLATDKDWWKGLQEVHQGIVLLHGYESPGLPIHQGLYAYESQKGHLIWNYPQEQFEALAEQSVQTKSKQGKIQVYALDSGKKLTAPPLSDSFREFERKKNAELSFPQASIQDDTAFATYHKEIKGHWDKNPHIHLDFLSLNIKEHSYRIFNFYEKNPSGSWNQYLGISTVEGPVFYRQLGTDLKGLSLDPFFSFQDFLIWIEDTHRLCYLKLG